MGKVAELQKWERYDGSDRMVTSKEYIEEKGETDFLKVLHSRFSRLDKTIDGFVPGELVVIGGPTGQGKTTLCLSLTEDFDREKSPSAWFSYEMQPERMIRRLGDDFPLFVLPRELEVSGLQWIEDRVMEAVAKYSIWSVFIDHLHYLVEMEDLARAGSTSILLGSILRGLKKIALKTETVIFLVSHLRKIQGDEPGIADLRDSSFTAQEADTVMLIWRDVCEEEGKDDTWLKVAKNRKEGKTGIIPLVFKDGRFYEMAGGDEGVK